MRLTLLLSILFTSTLAAEVKIQVTHSETCTRKTKAGDTITVNYRGTLPNGEEFDSSYGRNQPFGFTLGKGEVIAGWDQGLLDMCIGDKRTLDIPASLAYGANRGIGSCKADCELLFDTELMGIEGVSKETATPPVEEPVKQEPPVSARQNGLDHLILAVVGVLIVASVGMAFLWWRGRRGVKYQVLGQRNA